MNDPEKELAALVIDELNLEDIQLSVLIVDIPLYGEGFELDSIDILEIASLIFKRHGFELCLGDPDSQGAFALLGSLVVYVTGHRTRQARTSARHIPLSTFGRTDAMSMTGTSTSHLVLIPSYNLGHKVDDTVRSAHAQWNPAWVVVDGSTGGSTEHLQAMAVQDPGLRVIVLSRNRGEGVAVLAGLGAAAAAGSIYVLTTDVDGQRPANLILEFMTALQAAPDAITLGQPVFDTTASQMRVQGRRLSDGCTDIETLWTGVGNTLFGSRVYPIAPLAKIMCQQSWMYDFDFGPEAAVRLCRAGVRPVRLAAPVHYFRPDEGGVSHFRYLRDNILLIVMHLRLAIEGLLRLPSMITRRLQRGRQSAAGGFTPPPWRPWPGAAGFL